MKKLVSILGDLPIPTAEVAIIHDYNVMWGYESLNSEFKLQGKEINYEANFCRLHEELYKRNILSEIIPTDRDLSKYKLVILPSMMMIKEDFARKLLEYVEKGGILFAQGQMGMRDFNNNYLAIRGPEHLQDLMGVYINGGMYLNSAIQPDENWNEPKLVTLSLGGALGKKQVNGNARTWVGDIELRSGKAILRFLEDEYEGQAAIIENKAGRGLSIYSACISLDDSLLGEVFNYILCKAGIKYYFGLPEYVEIVERGDTTFVINHRNEAVNVHMDIEGKILMGAYEGGTVNLKPYGICIIKKS